MSKVVCVNENGIIYVESKHGDVFGIISPTEVIDEDGLPYQEDTLTVLDKADFILEQDWENESTYIEFCETNGETSRVVFSGPFVEYVTQDVLEKG